MATFGERVKQLRTDKKLKQQELADIFAVDRTTVGKWEQINTLPNQDMLKKLADYFEVSVDYLLGREEN